MNLSQEDTQPGDGLGCKVNMIKLRLKQLCMSNKSTSKCWSFFSTTTSTFWNSALWSWATGRVQWAGTSPQNAQPLHHSGGFVLILSRWNYAGPNSLRCNIHGIALTEQWVQNKYGACFTVLWNQAGKQEAGKFSYAIEPLCPTNLCTGLWWRFPWLFTFSGSDILIGFNCSSSIRNVHTFFFDWV